MTNELEDESETGVERCIRLHLEMLDTRKDLTEKEQTEVDDSIKLIDVCCGSGIDPYRAPPPLEELLEEEDGLLNALKLHNLATEYHLLCDQFDRDITGREDGVPTAGDQRRESILNARRVDSELFKEVEAMGFDKDTWRAAKRRAASLREK